MAYEHGVYDTDSHFIIDPKTRKITNNSGKSILMQHDHNSECFTFEIPRYIDGHDMSLCNNVEIHYINAGVNNKYAGIYVVSDLHVSDEDDTKVEFTWLIDGNVTQYEGTLTFIIRFVYSEEGIIRYAWHTTKYSDIAIVGVSYNSDVYAVIEEQYAGLFAEWENRINSIENTKVLLSTPQDLTDEEKINVYQNLNIAGDDTNRYEKVYIALLGKANYLKNLSYSIAPSTLGSPVTQILDGALEVASKQYPKNYGSLSYAVMNLAVMKNIIFRGTENYCKVVANRLESAVTELLYLEEGGYITFPFYVHYGDNEGHIYANTKFSLAKTTSGGKSVIYIILKFQDGREIVALRFDNEEENTYGGSRSVGRYYIDTASAVPIPLGCQESDNGKVLGYRNNTLEYIEVKDETVGELSGLTTENKDNIVSAINELVTRLEALENTTG